MFKIIRGTKMNKRKLSLMLVAVLGFAMSGLIYGSRSTKQDNADDAIFEDMKAVAKEKSLRSKISNAGYAVKKGAVDTVVDLKHGMGLVGEKALEIGSRSKNRMKDMSPKEKSIAIGGVTTAALVGIVGYRYWKEITAGANKGWNYIKKSIGL